MRKGTHPSMLSHDQDIGIACSRARHGVFRERGALNRRREILRRFGDGVCDADTLPIDEVAAEIGCAERDA